MDIFVILFVVLCFYGSKFTKKQWIADSSIENCNNMKGIFAICVLLHHIALRTTNGLFFKYFKHIGPLTVGIFFFLSGYGLMKQYVIRKKSYLKHYLTNRVGIITMQYLSVSLVYYLFRMVIGENISVIKFLQSFFNGEPIVYFSWYIIEIIVFYIFFYVACVVFKNNYINILIFMTIIIILFSAMCYILQYGSWWYSSNLTFLLGITYVILENKDIAKFNKVTTKDVVLSFTTFAFIFIVNSKAQEFINNQEVAAACFQIITCIFSLTVFMIFGKIKFNNKAISWLGRISFPIYVVQGIPMYLLHSDKLYISDDIVYTLLSISITIAIAYIVQKYFDFVSKTIKSKLT